MTGTAGFSYSDHRRQSEEARRAILRRFATGIPATVVFALTGVSAYAAFANFGIGWAQLAGASAWEAAVWPIAVTATTAQAFYCSVRITPGWHESWARWLFAVVAGAGVLLAGFGNGIRSGGYPHELNSAVSIFVLAVPGFCLLLSVSMTAAFILAISPPKANPTMPRSTSDLGRVVDGETSSLPLPSQE